MIAGQHITCGDMIFSGHSTFLILCACVMHEYCRDTQLPLLGKFACKALRLITWTACIIGLICIVGTKLHYTLDVLLAFYLTITIWSSYHLRCHFVAMRALHPELSSLLHPNNNAWQNFVDDFFDWMEAEEVQMTDHKAWMAFEGRLKKWKLTVVDAAADESNDSPFLVLLAAAIRV